MQSNYGWNKQMHMLGTIAEIFTRHCCINVLVYSSWYRAWIHCYQWKPCIFVLTNYLPQLNEVCNNGMYLVITLWLNEVCNNGMYLVITLWLNEVCNNGIYLVITLWLNEVSNNGMYLVITLWLNEVSNNGMYLVITLWLNEVCNNGMYLVITMCLRFVHKLSKTL